MSPASPAGYSGTPLPKKLGIREHSRVHLAGAPDVTLLFARTLAKLDPAFRRHAQRMASGGCVWALWPKQSSGVASDLSFQFVRRVGLEAGLVDTKVCAVDPTWSGLKFVIRVADRPRRAAPARKP